MDSQNGNRSDSDEVIQFLQSIIEEIRAMPGAGRPNKCVVVTVRDTPREADYSVLAYPNRFVEVIQHLEIAKLQVYESLNKEQVVQEADTRQLPKSDRPMTQ